MCVCTDGNLARQVLHAMLGSSGGCVAMKAASLLHGSLEVLAVTSKTVNFNEACEFVKDMKFEAWNRYLGQAKLDQKNACAGAMQEAVLTTKDNLQGFLEQTWKCCNNIRKFEPVCREFIDFPAWPEALNETVGARWHADGFYEVMTLRAFLTSTKLLDSPIFLVGRPQTHKSYTGENIARLFCVMTGKKQYLQSGNLDDWGVLSGNRAVDESACSLMDDCPTLTCNGRPLTSTEMIQLLIVRTISSYGARYHPATFPAKHGKIFICNVDVEKDAVEHDRHSFPRTCPWLVASARACFPSKRDEATQWMKEFAGTVGAAQARRPMVFHFDKTPYNEENIAQMQETDEAVMRERLARMDAFFGK